MKRQLLIGSTWTDEKGRKWEVKEMASVGIYRCVTECRTRLAELRPYQIRAAIEQHKLRVLSTPKVK